MTTRLNRSTVLQRLAELDRRDRGRRVFGAASHGYKLNAPLPSAVIETFEKRHGASLPEDYHLFLTEIGNGGAGPYYGLLPFGRDDDDRDWDGGGLVGDPGQPFPHTTAWNLPDSFWDGEPDLPQGTPSEVEDRLMEAWDRELEQHYWNPAVVNGAVPICHLGCALRQWLVVHGEQKGNVWNDFRADWRGLSPVLGGRGEPLSFADWYMGWLDDSLAGKNELPFLPAVPWWQRGWRPFRRRR